MDSRPAGGRGVEWLPLFNLEGRSRLQFQSFDGDYLDRLRAGDFRTQEHFVAYFSELLDLKLRARLRSIHDIEDVKQETFARVLIAIRKEQGIRAPERLGPFVNSVCANVLRERYRAGGSSETLDPEQLDIPDPSRSVIEVITDKQTQQKVREILNELPERDRRIIKELFIDERGKDDVCRDYGVTRDYLRVLLHRAKQSFKSQYLKSIGVAEGNARDQVV